MKTGNYTVLLGTFARYFPSFGALTRLKIKDVIEEMSVPLFLCDMQKLLTAQKLLLSHTCVCLWCY